MSSCTDFIHDMPKDQNPHQVSIAFRSFIEKFNDSVTLAKKICTDVIKNGGRMVWIFNPSSHASNVDGMRNALDKWSRITAQAGMLILDASKILRNPFFAQNFVGNIQELGKIRS
eukprot:6276020-Karenia_brevis.AAC.1